MREEIYKFSTHYKNQFQYILFNEGWVNIQFTIIINLFIPLLKNIIGIYKIKAILVYYT